MKRPGIIKAACTVALSAVCALAIAGCGGESNNSNSGMTGGVAAVINGSIEIPEDEVTKAVESARAQMGLSEPEDWGMWMAQNDYDPEKIRDEMVEGLVAQELVRVAAEEQGFTVDEAEVDGYVEQMKSNYDSDDAWNEALSSAGLSEDQYRDNIELSLLSQQIGDSLTPEEPTNDELLMYANIYGTSYNGAKKSSHILFDSSDEATAQDVLNRINSGELDFAEAAKEYSKDTASAENGGDVGWDALNSFVNEYQQALNGLDKDQVSGLVESTYGIHIIKVTDVYNAPEEVTSMDQLPQEFQEYVTAIVKQSKQSEAYKTWMEDYREKADVVINPMPENVPYNLDMAPYEEAVAEQKAAEGTDTGEGTEGTDGTEGDTTGTEGTADGDAATDTGEGTENGEGTDAGTTDGATNADAGATDGATAEGDASADSGEGTDAGTNSDQAKQAQPAEGDTAVSLN